MGGGGSAPTPQDPPWKERVQWIDSDFTSWDQGETWREDPNYHFFYGGEHYYIENMADVEDQSRWRVDTMSDWHHSQDQHTAYQKRQEAEAKAREAHDAQMRNLERQQAYMAAMQESMARAAAERSAYYAKLDKAAASAAAEAKTKEERRRRLASMGRSNLNLTGGRGAEMDEANVLKRKLGGGATA